MTKQTGLPEIVHPGLYPVLGVRVEGSGVK